MTIVGGFVLSVFMSLGSARAEEGMWLPHALPPEVVAAMQSMGLELSAGGLYAHSGPSLHRAVVNVGNVGSGSVVSERGLVLTNHHVIYDHLQRISNPGNDLLSEGYWAASLEGEIPLNGLSVSFLIRIEDVTERVDSLQRSWEEEHGNTMRQRQLQRELGREITDGTHYRARLASFFEGSRQLLFVYEVFDDVRLVGAPPSSIGKFGGDTDNFIWPRHAGDFAFIRVYAGPGNLPAAYGPANAPFETDVFFELDIGGIAEGDFSMTLGYPGSTRRYVSAAEVEELLETGLPARILSREKRLPIIERAMLDNDTLRLHYASDFFNASNGLKLALGQYEQMRIHNVAAKKQEREERFRQWMYQDSLRLQNYGKALDMIREAVEGRRHTLFAHSLLNESLLMGTQVYVAGIRASIFGRIFDREDPSREEILEAAAGFGEKQQDFYREYPASIDLEVVIAMMELLKKQLDTSYLPGVFAHVDTAFGGDTETFARHMFANSFVTDRERFDAFMANPDAAVLAADPAIMYAESIYDKAIELRDLNHRFNDVYREGRRTWVLGLKEMAGGSPMYPDANFTMRLSYGRVLGYSPADAVSYSHYTTLRGVMEKEDPGHHEFVVPPLLRNLYEEADYGIYGSGGEMPVNFISGNDITGGNSGSPVLNGSGRISGLVFCGNWESLNGDVIYLEESNRAINVDIRYVLLITDRYARADHIMNELVLFR